MIVEHEPDDKNSCCYPASTQPYFIIINRKSKTRDNMVRKINAFRTLMLLVDQDQSNHVIKDLALLLVSALRDWPTENRNDIAKCITEFKAYFGDPFTFVNGRIVNIVHASDWTWRGESGAALSEMIELSVEHFQLADFDEIVDKVLRYYEER